MSRYVYPRPRSERLRPEDASARAELAARQARQAELDEETRRENARYEAQPIEVFYQMFEDAVHDATADFPDVSPDDIAHDMLESVLHQTPVRHRAELRRMAGF